MNTFLKLYVLLFCFIVMRLRCRSRQLLFHSAFFDNNEILEKDADVLFMCGDGGCVRGHKLILAAQSTFFTDVLRDQVCFFSHEM